MDWGNDERNFQGARLDRAQCINMEWRFLFETAKVRHLYSDLRGYVEVMRAAIQRTLE